MLVGGRKLANVVKTVTGIAVQLAVKQGIASTIGLPETLLEFAVVEEFTLMVVVPAPAVVAPAVPLYKPLKL
jgi:hypothetical protein